MSEQTKAAGMLCPVCKVTLVMTDRQGVEIDYCPQCGGVWLDRGELDKILERSAAQSGGGPPSAAAYAPLREQRDQQFDRRRDFDDDDDDDDSRRGDKRRRRGSFLDDIFDFG
jgi:Zn-finger nucleic acid-binding protein